MQGVGWDALLAVVADRGDVEAGEHAGDRSRDAGRLRAGNAGGGFRVLTDEDHLVFPAPDGGNFDDSALRRGYYKALKAAKIAHLRFHGLRHTFGTLAVQEFRFSDVKSYMGHADIATTMIYVHHVPQHDAADRLSSRVSKASSASFALDRAVARTAS